MTENDYIAEYVKERMPEVLGLNFSLWYLARRVGEVMNKVLPQFAKVARDMQKALDEVDRYPGETEDILKKIEEAGEDE